MDCYVLMGKLAVPARWRDWLRWLATADRRVARTTIGPIHVSTVFLGLDHSQGRRGQPQLFETKVFRGGEGCEMHRYPSWEAAEAGHEAAVARVRAEIIASAKGGPYER